MRNLQHVGRFLLRHILGRALLEHGAGQLPFNSVRLVGLIEKFVIDYNQSKPAWRRSIVLPFLVSLPDD